MRLALKPKQTILKGCGADFVMGAVVREVP
jgi:hypothetical protein